MNKRFGVFSSSVDPQKLSLTIRGILKSVAAVAIALSPLLNIGVEDVQNVFDSVDSFLAGLDSLIIAGLGVYGLGETVWGAIRKILVAKSVIKVS